MLESISWSEFFYAVTCLVVIYYSITILLLYRKEIINLFRKGNEQGARKPGFMSSQAKPSEIMGAIQPDAPTTTHQSLTANELHVAPAADTDSNTVNDGLLVGVVSDLVNEIITLIISVTNREEGEQLIKQLLSRYPQLTGSRFQPAITELIIASCRDQHHWKLDTTSVDSWWPTLDSDNPSNT